MENIQSKKEQELNSICKECIDIYSELNPTAGTFNYRMCERCETGREVHLLEQGGDWDNAPFASTKMGK